MRVSFISVKHIILTSKLMFRNEVLTVFYFIFYFLFLFVSELNFIEKYASQIFNESFTIGSSFTLPNVRLNLSQILSVVPTIEESLPIHSSNELCAKHSRFVLRSANQLEIWALKCKCITFTYYTLSDPFRRFYRAPINFNNTLTAK